MLTGSASTASDHRRTGPAAYKIAARSARLAFRSAFHLGVISAERIPARGPLVVVSNHESYLDGPLLLAVFPGRRLTFFSAAYLFEKPATGRVLRCMGALPVEAQSSNLASIKAAIAVLRAGGTMAVFPGGGIAREEVLGGAAYLALKANAPVLPVHIEGTAAALPPGSWRPALKPIAVRVGRPLLPSDLVNGSSDMRSAVAAGTSLLGHALYEARCA